VGAPKRSRLTATRTAPPVMSPPSFVMRSGVSTRMGTAHGRTAVAPSATPKPLPKSAGVPSMPSW